MRYLVAVLMGVVAALLLGVIAGLAVGGAERGGQVSLVVAILGFVVFVILWVRHSTDVRTTFRRSLLTVAVESFAMPLAGFVFSGIMAGQQSSRAAAAGALVGGGIVTTVVSCVGIALGLFCLVLYLALRAEPQPRPATQV